MSIEIGDTVQVLNNTIFGGIQVLKIEGEIALCSYLGLNQRSDGDERPTVLSKKETISH